MSPTKHEASAVSAAFSQDKAEPGPPANHTTADSSAASPSGVVPSSTGDAEAAAAMSAPSSTETDTQAPVPTLSKNALKRLRKVQEWEDGREERKRRRREKRVDRKARRKEEHAALVAEGADPATLIAKKAPAQLVPVTFVIDCGFESFMTDKEGVSLASQVTRCYSDNRHARYKGHLWISSWGGKLRERFETTMESQHKMWNGVGFEEGDFLAAALRARESMRSTKDADDRDAIPSLKRSRGAANTWEKDEEEPFPLEDPIPPLDGAYQDVVYLTSESPYTLVRLESHTTYVIGGLVDRNREKGLCYRRAVEKGIRTAKLPIGQYMLMRSRQILATNHVLEIMLRWLECEDWGAAFTHVIPKRKGGVLRADIDGSVAPEQGEAGDVPAERTDEDRDQQNP